MAGNLYREAEVGTSICRGRHLQGDRSVPFPGTAGYNCKSSLVSGVRVPVTMRCGLHANLDFAASAWSGYHCRNDVLTICRRFND